MKLTSKPNDQYILVAIASALAYLSWVIYEPTMGICSTLHNFFPIGRVFVYWGWLLFVCLRAKPSSNWSWKQFTIGAFIGGFALAIVLIILGAILWYPETSFIRKIQPIVELAPYASVSGIVSAYERNIKNAIAAALIMLFYQMATDFIVWLPWSCVY